MLEVAFSCLVCSRMFLQDCPFDGPVPRHLDPLLGHPCPGSGRTLQNFLEIAAPGHEHPRDALDWPRWDTRHRHREKAPGETRWRTRDRPLPRSRREP